MTTTPAGARYAFVLRMFGFLLIPLVTSASPPIYPIHLMPGLETIIFAQKKTDAVLVSKPYSPWMKLARKQEDKVYRALWEDRIPLQFPKPVRLGDEWPYRHNVAQANHEEETLASLITLALNSH